MSFKWGDKFHFKGARSDRFGRVIGVFPDLIIARIYKQHSVEVFGLNVIFYVAIGEHEYTPADLEQHIERK